MAGITYTDDPAFFNDERYQVILSTVDEAERLRGLNFRVTFVVLCEMGNISNARNLLQAIRAGRMCYNIEKIMRVFIFWRGFQYQVGTEKQAAENIKEILEEIGYETRDICITHNPDQKSSQVELVDVPNRLLHGQSQAPWSNNIFTKGEYVPFVKKATSQEYANMINQANRPAVCACNRPQCKYLHVRHVLGMLTNILGVSRGRIDYIIRELETYPRFIPLECRLRSGFQPCREYSYGNYKPSRCDNLASCKKAHYYEIIQKANGKTVISYLPYQSAFGQTRVPLHLHCTRAFRETCHSSEGRACSIPIIPGTQHSHDCHLPHCEVRRQPVPLQRTQAPVFKPTLSTPKQNPWQKTAVASTMTPVASTVTARQNVWQKPCDAVAKNPVAKIL
jgi:hypothetical protein